LFFFSGCDLGVGQRAIKVDGAVDDLKHEQRNPVSVPQRLRRDDAHAGRGQAALE